MHDLEIYYDLINRLIIFKEILEDIDKISKVVDLEINNKIRELEFLEEALRIEELRSGFLGIPSNAIEEEINNIEELKWNLKWESKGAKIIKDLDFEKSDEIVEIAKIQQKLIRSGASKELISFSKKLIVPKKYLHLVS